MTDKKSTKFYSGHILLIFFRITKKASESTMGLWPLYAYSKARIVRIDPANLCDSLELDFADY